ncbi:MAG: putative stage IV sporulation protein YqfD [Firmicutes bacterium ADurb.Bin456]|nr:MAG: putative stage IV sporulation protein YqfD [Firmicutes bacterium ADurb.Bin456]
MLLFRLMSFLLGYVTISVAGPAPEKFINMATSRGISLWEVNRSGDGSICLKVRISAIKPMRHIARRTRCRFRILRREGLPFYIARLRRRKTLALGAVFCVCVLYLLTSLVWFIEVKGNEQLSSEELLKVAAEAGLTRGVAKWQVETDAVEAKIMERLPLVAWTGVYLKGTRVIIEVSERTVPVKEDNRPAHIVAGKAGLIKEILVISGHPVVREGDTVAPGQVLISGEIPALEEQSGPGEVQKPGQKPKLKRPASYVHARGIVRARVWYEGYGEVPLLEEGRRPTGRSETRISIKFEGKEIILSGSKNIPFKIYRTDTLVKSPPPWRNLTIPVELVTVKYFELLDYREERNRGEARSLAEEKALQEALASLPQNARLETQLVEEVHTGRPENLMRVRAMLEVVEDIGTDKYFGTLKSQ